VFVPDKFWRDEHAVRQHVCGSKKGGEKRNQEGKGRFFHKSQAVNFDASLNQTELTVEYSRAQNLARSFRLAPSLFVVKVSPQFHPSAAAVFPFNLNLTK
jgi:hypothetical protein